MTLAEPAFPYRRRLAPLRFESAMNRDIPNTHTHSGIKIFIGRAFFCAAERPGLRGHGPFAVVRHPTKMARERGTTTSPSRSRCSRDGSLSSIVPFCPRPVHLRSFTSVSSLYRPAFFPSCVSSRSLARRRLRRGGFQWAFLLDGVTRT